MVSFTAALTLVAALGLTNVHGAPLNITKRGSGKAGISWPVQETSAAPVTNFFGSGSALTWWFDWNKNYGTELFLEDSTNVAVNAQFVPMEYDASFLDNSNPLEAGWTEIMGYNEPDLHSSTGVSTAVAYSTAAGTWKTMVDTLRAQNPNAQFYSPAVASDKNWLTQFFAAICPGGLKGCEYAPNYLSIHVYSTTSAGFISDVTGYHNSFPELPVVVSEYACYSYDGSNPQPSAAAVSTYMKETTSWLDTTPWIHKYAWFGAMRNSQWLYGVAEANMLMTTTGELTALGEQYVGGGQ